MSDIVQINRETGDIIHKDTIVTNNISIGVVVPRDNKSVVSYLNNAREYALDPTQDIHDIIKLCNLLYLREGVINTAIDLLVDYAITELEVDGLVENSKEKDLLDWWLQNVNVENSNMEPGITGLISEMMLEYWITGNVFPYRRDSKVKSLDIGSKTMRDRNVNLPMSIYLLDPMFIEIPEYEVIIGGEKQIFLQLDDSFMQKIKIDKDLESKLLTGLTPADAAKLKKDGLLRLKSENVSHIKRKSRGYEVWGVPYLIKTFGSIARKKKLQALDEATIDGLINHITIFKIGEPSNIDESRDTWHPDRIRAFATLLRNPNHSNYLVWGPDVDVITVAPNENILALDKKYVQVDKDILKSMGIPTVLLSGEGSTADNTENVWVAISSLMEKIESARRQIKRYIEEIMYDALVINGMSTKMKPRLRWRKPNLRNEKEFGDFVLALYDRGLLPIKLTVKEAGHSWSEIKEGRVAELKEKLDGYSYEEVFTRRDVPGATLNEKKDKSTNKSLPAKPKNKDSKNKSKANTEDFKIDIIENAFDGISKVFGTKSFELNVRAHFYIISEFIKNICVATDKDFNLLNNKLNGVMLELISISDESEMENVKSKVLDIMKGVGF